MSSGRKCGVSRWGMGTAWSVVLCEPAETASQPACVRARARVCVCVCVCVCVRHYTACRLVLKYVYGRLECCWIDVQDVFVEMSLARKCGLVCCDCHGRVVVDRVGEGSSSV